MKTQNNITGITLHDVIERLKSEVPIEDVANTLGLPQKLNLQKSGKNLQGDCITGHPSQNHQCFSIDTSDNYFYCFNCGISGDIINLVRESEDVGMFEALRWLSEQFAPSVLPEIEKLHDNLSEEKKEFYQRGALFQKIYREGKRLLSEPQGKVALDYLVKVRGYDPNVLLQTEFIFWDTDKNIREFLKESSPNLEEQIDNLRLQGAFGDVFRLAIPYRDRFGTITGFMKRAHNKTGFTINGKDGIRWDSTLGLAKADLYGLHKIKNEDTVIAVEGYPDATYLPALRLKNIVAFGQGRFSEKYFEGLNAKGIKRIILALDNDIKNRTGLKNTVELCELFISQRIELYIIDPSLYGVHKDPDEYVIANGIDAFKQLISHAKYASEWYVEHLLKSANLNSDPERSAAIQKVLEIADSMPSSIDCNRALDILQKETNTPIEVINLEFENVKKKRANKKLIDESTNLALQIKWLVNEGKEDEVGKLLVEKPSEILSNYASHRVVQERSTYEYLKFKKERDSKRVQGQRLGLELKTFTDIDVQLNGVQPGLYIIGAYPNVGKTAFMTSLCLDVLESNDEAAVLFFTMDDSRDTIINRFLAGKSQLEINSVQVTQSSAMDQALLDSAYAWFGNKSNDGKFDVKEISESLTMDAIEHTIRMHPRRDNLVVFIDGVYNVPMEGRFSSLREENIERANRIKQIVKFFNRPLVVTAELRKKTNDEGKSKKPTMHDLMETGKYGYNADVVWLIYPKNEAEYISQAEPIITVDFGKNKLSSFREKMDMTFVRAKSLIKPLPMNGGE